MTWTEYQDSMTIDQLRQAAIDETRQAMASGEMSQSAGEEMITYLKQIKK